MSSNYDYSLSTEDNYGTFAPAVTSGNAFVGKFAKFRENLDYEYHKHYCAARQLVQDEIMEQFTKTLIVDSAAKISCTSPLQNWLVFTAGVMGAGKSHTLKALHRHNIIALESFVRVDPDDIRALLPEFKEYTQRDFSSAGKLTQKEVGYLSEVLTLYALSEGKNILIDGSLRNAPWHKMYIQQVRDQYKGIKIAIMHVTASESTVLARCKRREAVTGRHVPEELIRATTDQLPISIFALAPYVDAVITLENEDKEPEKDSDLKTQEPPPPSYCAKFMGLESSDLPRIVESEVLTRYIAGEVVPLSLTDAPKNVEELMSYFVMSCAPTVLHSKRKRE